MAALAKSFNGHPLGLRRRVVEGFRKCASAAWTERFTHPESITVNNGPGGVVARVALEELLRLNTVLGNVMPLHGAFHKPSPHHLGHYLAECCDRFNRRFDLAAMLPRPGSATAQRPPMPYRLLLLAEAHC